VSTEGLEARVRALEATVQELTARVRVTEDIDEIQQLPVALHQRLDDHPLGRCDRVLRRRRPDLQSLFWVQGFYDMDYVRENGRWKIKVMRWTERLGLPGGGPPEGLW
jgi:hypothetical protein